MPSHADRDDVAWAAGQIRRCPPLGVFLGLLVFSATVMTPLCYNPGWGKMIALALLFSLPWGWLAIRGELKQSLLAPRWDLPDYALMVFVAATLFACATSLDPRLSVKYTGGFALIGIGTYLLARILLVDPDRVRILGYVWLTLAVFLIILALGECIFQKYYILKIFFVKRREGIYGATYPYFSRLVLFWLNPVPAAHMVVFWLGAIGMTWIFPPRRRWFVIVFIAAGSLVSVWYTQTRGMLLVLLFTLAFCAAMHNKKLSVVVLLVAVLGFWGLKPYWPKRIKLIAREGVRARGLRVRPEHWFYALHMMRDRPWIGIGPRVGAYGGGTGAISKGLADYTPVLYDSGETHFQTHVRERRTFENAFLTVFVENGLIAGLALVVFFASVIVDGFRGALRSSDRPPWLRAFEYTLAACMLAFAIGALEHDAFSWHHLSAWSFLTAGTLRAIRRLDMDRRRDPFPPDGPALA